MDTQAAELERGDFRQLEKAIQGVKEGDVTSFSLLHRTYFNLVVAIAYRVLNDRHDAEDVAQEVFSKLWTRAKLYDRQRGNPKTWLAAMARNRAIDRLRSKKRRAQLRDDLFEHSLISPQANREDVFADVRRGEEAAVIRDGVRRLSREQQQAIEMTFFSGLSQSQAAEALGAPLGTVKARIRRGIMRLRTLVPELRDCV